MTNLNLPEAPIKVAGAIEVKVYRKDGSLKSEYKQPFASLVRNGIRFLYAMMTNTSAALVDLGNTTINLAWQALNASTLNWCAGIGWGDTNTAYDYDQYGLSGSRGCLGSLSITAINESSTAADFSLTAGFTIVASRECKEIILIGRAGNTSAMTFCVARDVLVAAQAVDIGDTLAVTWKPLLKA